MTPFRTAVCCLAFPATVLFCLSAGAQSPVTKWTLSFNPYGLLEPPAAIGLGVGYRLNKKVELWSESSFITKGSLQADGPVTGIRQIFQVKYFIDKNCNFFFAAEIRYKSYQYRDKDEFYNPATKDTLVNFSNFARHHFFGAGLQLGWRTRLSRKSERFLLELTAGLGVRKVLVDREGIPPGYEYMKYRSIDLNIRDITGPDLYLPGSMRLIWCFGKHIRP